MGASGVWAGGYSAHGGIQRMRCWGIGCVGARGMWGHPAYEMWGHPACGGFERVGCVAPGVLKQ